jgi:signal transduction histidine kinase
MSLLKRSLLARLILAFWVVSISGIAIIALLAGRVSQREFDRFVKDTQQYQDVVDKLATYYSEHGSFSGAGYLLEEAQRQSQSQPPREYIVVDMSGKVLLAADEKRLSKMISPELLGRGVPIVVNDQVVARLIPLIPFPPPKSFNEIASENLRRINTNLFIGAGFATLLALLLGWIIARTITRPLRELNAAAQSIAHGDLENRVDISTRDEIGTLAASFNSMVASLKKSRDLRRQMTADIAHELRNPLSIILGHAEALSEGVLPPDPETLHIIYDEARHLSRLVEDLRTLSLSEAGELPLQRSPASPKEILDRAATAYATRATEKGIHLEVEASTDLPAIDVDVERISQVIFNLLDNSLKYTPTGGRVRLRASAADGWVDMKVQDNGSGIPADELPLVFERFYRGKQSSERAHDGSGLGLAISRTLVELHQGQITIESENQQGVTVTLRFPAMD